MLIASFTETRKIGMEVARALKAKYTEIFVEDFPDGEYHLALKKNPKNERVVIINSIINEVDNKIIETVLAAGIARDYGAKEVFLVATYFPYMRQDKHFMKYDSLSSKYILKLFSNFDRIIAIDPHLHRIHKMNEASKNAESISTNDLIVDYIKKRFKKDFTILGPDSESAQWVSPIASKLGKKVIVLEKTRLSSTHIKQKKVNEKFSKNVIIIDDIISTGKTLAGALKMAKDQGAKNLICIGIHGVLVNGADKLVSKYSELITTNTIPNKYAKIDVSPIIVKALRKK